MSTLPDGLLKPPVGLLSTHPSFMRGYTRRFIEYPGQSRMAYVTAKPVFEAGSLRCNDELHRRKLRHCAFQEPSNITAAQNEAWTFSTPRGSPTPNFSIGCRKILDSTPNRSIVLQMQRRIATSICTYNADPRIQRRSAKRIAIQRRTTFWHWMLPNQH